MDGTITRKINRMIFSISAIKNASLFTKIINFFRKIPGNKLLMTRYPRGLNYKILSISTLKNASLFTKSM
jgi:hypothetical protein